MEEPIVITGAGIVSAIGVGMKETLASLKAGKTGIGEMKYLTSRHRDLPVGEVPLSNAEMMKMLGNPARFGYPVFVVLDENGKVIHTQDSALLEEGDSYNKKKVMSFFKLWTPKAVKG